MSDWMKNPTNLLELSQKFDAEILIPYGFSTEKNQTNEGFVYKYPKVCWMWHCYYQGFEAGKIAQQIRGKDQW